MSIADGHINIVTEEKLLDMLEIDNNLYEEVKAWGMAKIRNYGIPKSKKQSNATNKTAENKSNKNKMKKAKTPARIFVKNGNIVGRRKRLIFRQLEQN